MKALNPILKSVADRWWVPLCRGLAAIIFGALTLIVPGFTLLSMVFVWGAYTFIDGVAAVAYSIGERKNLPGWGWLVVQGIAGLAMGVCALFFTGLVGPVLLFVIAGWAIGVGAMQIAVAITWRRELTGEWRLVLSGVLSTACGVLIFLFPGAGALSLAWLIGANAIVFGVLMFALAARLYRLGHRHTRQMDAAAHAA